MINENIDNEEELLKYLELLDFKLVDEYYQYTEKNFEIRLIFPENDLGYFVHIAYIEDGNIKSFGRDKDAIRLINDKLKYRLRKLTLNKLFNEQN